MADPDFGGLNISVDLVNLTQLHCAVQLRTSKLDNFIFGSGDFFGIKLSAGTDSESQITSKTGVV